MKTSTMRAFEGNGISEGLFQCKNTAEIKQDHLYIKLKEPFVYHTKMTTCDYAKMTSCMSYQKGDLHVIPKGHFYVILKGTNACHTKTAACIT